MTSKVVLVTDSTAYIPRELVEQYDIRVAPQVLVWGDETYRDGVDIQPDEFYQRLRTAKVMPTTSQASPQEFQKIFTDITEEGRQALAIVLSADLSGTLTSVHQAAEMFPGTPIEVVDSRTTAMAMGFLVLEAARAAEQGASLAECKTLVEEARQKTGVIFAVDTLEFLHRGGRIGGGARLLGTALNLKPILEVSSGHIEPVEKVRTRKKSLTRLVELICDRVDGQRPVHLASLHANAPEEAQQLLEQAKQEFETVETVYSTVSPVVGTHAGPGTVGMAYLAGM